MKPSLTLFVAILATAPSAGCTPNGASDSVSSAQQELIGGAVPTAETDTDPEAVALTFSSNFSFCTGTLVSPQVVMTAGHCVDMLSGDPNVTVFFGTDLSLDGTRIGVSKARAHPEWNGNLSSGHDIGLVLMNFRAPDAIAPVPLYTTPITAADMGRDVHRVGFGIYDSVTQDSDGRKRVGDTTLTALSGPDYFIAGDDNLITCSGDSGGPGFVFEDGVKKIAGVHSFGFEGCTTPDNGDTRVHLYADSFVLPWIQENDPTCGEDGFCARVGCVDDPDCEPCGPDGTCAMGCALPDPDCTTQEIGQICQANSQCKSDLCVFWTGDVDSKFCSEPCAASSECPSGMSCQNVSPFGRICYYDEDPPGVVGSDCTAPTDCGSYICEEGACVTECNLATGKLCPQGFECSTLDDQNFYCHSTASGGGGGCAVDSRAPGWAGLAVLLMLGMARRRRRSRG